MDCINNQLTDLLVNKSVELRELYCSRNQLKTLDLSNSLQLEKLHCFYNQLSSIDVSNSLALKELFCSDNQLTTLDVSKNASLVWLSVFRNQLTELDVTNNLALEVINSYRNNITSIDVSKNIALTKLDLYNNQLTRANLANGKNRQLTTLDLRRNTNLTCIQTDAGFGPIPAWRKDANAEYSENCNYNLSTQEQSIVGNMQILNPVGDNLIIQTKANIERVEIYNVAGQLVKVLLKGNTAVQDLPKGVYLIKVTTDKGVITEKIIKK